MNKDAGVVTHDIQVRNFIMGTSRLLELALPEGWELTKGVGSPEVSAVHERQGKRWAATARAWYVVYHPEHRWAAELAVRIFPSPPKTLPQNAQPFEVNGHVATVGVHHRRRGLPWRRHTVTFLTIGWHCPHSDRYIELEYSGWCPEEGFEALKQAAAHAGCH